MQKIEHFKSLTGAQGHSSGLACVKNTNLGFHLYHKRTKQDIQKGKMKEWVNYFAGALLTRAELHEGNWKAIVGFS